MAPPFFKRTLLLVGLFISAVCSEPPNLEKLPNGPLTTEYTYEVVKSYPHDPNAFTQGLTIIGNNLYEGTGNYGQSSLRRVLLETGEIKQARNISPTLFGEGIALFDEKIIQLTWKSGIGFIYDQKTFNLLRSVSYPGEGWGITYDGHQFIMSDGTSTLYFRDKVTFEETKRITVRDDKGKVSQLNELEYVDGEIYANIWQEDRIACINPSSGLVNGWIGLEGLLQPKNSSPGSDVLNGIAYDNARRHLFVTGKLWPKLYQIRRVKREF